MAKATECLFVIQSYILTSVSNKMRFLLLLIVTYTFSNIAQAGERLFSPTVYVPIYSVSYSAPNNSKTLPLFSHQGQVRASGIASTGVSLWPMLLETGNTFATTASYVNYFQFFKGASFTHIHLSDTVNQTSAMAYFHSSHNLRKFKNNFYDITIGTGFNSQRLTVDTPFVSTQQYNSFDLEAIFSFRSDLDLFNKYVSAYIATKGRFTFPKSDGESRQRLSLPSVQLYGEGLFYTYRAVKFTRYVIPSLHASIYDSDYIKSRFTASCYYSPNYHFKFRNKIIYYLVGATSLLFPSEVTVDFQNYEDLYYGLGWHFENFYGYIKKRDPNRSRWRLAYTLRMAEPSLPLTHEISFQFITTSSKMQTTSNDSPIF